MVTLGRKTAGLSESAGLPPYLIFLPLAAHPCWGDKFMHRLEELLLISRDWSKKTRGSEVVRAAIHFLRENFHIEAGFFTYKRAPKVVDYLRTTHRWFTSWGLCISDDELSAAVDTQFLGTSFCEQKWTDVDELPDYWKNVFGEAGIQQISTWVMRFDDQPVGVFTVGRKCKYADDSKVISYCMSHISVLLELILQRRISEELALRDPLTGLYNRRGFLREFNRMVEKQEGFTLAVLDIDRFKQTNDQFGHHVGDSVLIQVGEILTTETGRLQGICGRLGGDEFVVLGRMDAKDANAAANTVSAWFSDLAIEVSVGCAPLASFTRDFDTAYRLADERLYVWKASAGQPSTS